LRRANVPDKLAMRYRTHAAYSFGGSGSLANERRLRFAEGAEFPGSRRRPADMWRHPCLVLPAYPPVVA
jgi:hypothetical protein